MAMTIRPKISEVSLISLRKRFSGVIDPAEIRILLIFSVITKPYAKRFFFTPVGTPPHPRFVFDTVFCPCPVQVTVGVAGFDLGTVA
jgi:hypothetical protein